MIRTDEGATIPLIRQSHEDEEGTPTRPQTRKAYERPSIIFREKLEVAAVLCSSNPGGKADFATCPTGPINS